MHLPAAAATCLLLLVLTGCNGDPAESQGAAPAAGASASDVPGPAAQTTAPATTSGPLTKADLPDAQDLGADWTPKTDPGGHGHLGNGSFVRARDVHEVAMSLVPLGCVEIGQPPSLPVPEHALEATFRGPDGRAAVALVLEYADQTAALGLVEQLGRLLASCPQPGAEVDRPTLVVELLRPDRNTIQDVRREIGPGAAPGAWSEVVVRKGNRVGMTIVQSADVDFARLTATLRSVVG